MRWARSFREVISSKNATGSCLNTGTAQTPHHGMTWRHTTEQGRARMAQYEPGCRWRTSSGKGRSLTVAPSSPQCDVVGLVQSQCRDAVHIPAVCGGGGVLSVAVNGGTPATRRTCSDRFASWTAVIELCGKQHIGSATRAHSRYNHTYYARHCVSTALPPRTVACAIFAARPCRLLHPPHPGTHSVARYPHCHRHRTDWRRGLPTITARCVRA